MPDMYKCIPLQDILHYNLKIIKESAIEQFGESLVFKKVYRGVTDGGEIVTIEEFIRGSSQNTSITMACCVSHTFEKKQRQLCILLYQKEKRWM